MTQREEFEAWHRTTQANPLKLDAEGEYGNAFTAARWEAWQAAQVEARELSDADIEALWQSLDGKSIITGANQINWNRLVRTSFARAVLAAARSAK